MSLYRDVAVVLRTHKLGEADRVVVLLCRSTGKVRAVAKGVRRTKSKFGSRLEPGSHVEVQLHEGRGELDLVTQAETVESRPASRAVMWNVARQWCSNAARSPTNTSIMARTSSSRRSAGRSGTRR